MSNKAEGGRGIVFTDLLCLVFIALKLTGHIDWGWLWILSPIWVPFIPIVGLGMVAIALGRDK